MSEVVFVRTRTDYGSYQDYWKLVELNEYPVVYIDEVPSEGVKDTTFIVTPSNGEWQNGIQTDGRVILWDFEHRIDEYPRIPGCAEYWHMDAAQARQHGVRYVPLGGDARLNPSTERTSEPVAYDIVYMAYMTWRRQRVEAQLRDYGLRIAQNAWGNERHQKLMRSTAYLHVHQLDHAPGVPALRMVVAAAYRLPVIAETFADAGIFVDMTMEAEFSELASSVDVWTRAYKGIQEYGDALYRLLCEEYTFRRGIEGHV